MHPSLIAKQIKPAQLNPQRVMKRNEKCWCLSGKKWKVCHRDRHLQKKVTFGEAIDNLGKKYKSGECLHPNASPTECSNKLIEAHTVQRAKGLAAIAKNGHVQSVKKGFSNINKNKGIVIPELIGTRKASTFTGFCSKHDNSLFKSLEGEKFVLNNKTAFLFVFRALAYEFLTKKNSLNITEQRELDRGKDFSTQARIQQDLYSSIQGSQRGMNDIQKWKAQYDSIFKENLYSDFSYFAIEFSTLLPFVCSGAFHPEVDFEGRRLQHVAKGNSEFEHVCYNVTSLESRTYLIISWNGSTNGPAEKFSTSYKNLNNTEKANAAVILAAEQLENVYFDPIWWEDLDEIKKGLLIARMQSGVGFNSKRENSTFLNLEKILLEVRINTETGTI